MLRVLERQRESTFLQDGTVKPTLDCPDKEASTTGKSACLTHFRAKVKNTKVKWWNSNPTFISCSIGGAEWTLRCQRVALEKLRENQGAEELGADDQALNESLMQFDGNGQAQVVSQNIG